MPSTKSKKLARYLMVALALFSGLALFATLASLNLPSMTD